MARSSEVAGRRREYQRRYYKANKARMNAASRLWYAANRERVRMVGRANHLKRTFGLSPEEHAALFISQGERCANPGCLSPDPGSKTGWHTDHNHRNRLVRGILCHGCNIALGAAKENPAVLRGLADYAEKHAA